MCTAQAGSMYCLCLTALSCFIIISSQSGPAHAQPLSTSHYKQTAAHIPARAELCTHLLKSLAAAALTEAALRTPSRAMRTCMNNTIGWTRSADHQMFLNVALMHLPLAEDCPCLAFSDFLSPYAQSHSRHKVCLLNLGSISSSLMHN